MEGEDTQAEDVIEGDKGNRQTYQGQKDCTDKKKGSLQECDLSDLEVMDSHQLQ